MVPNGIREGERALELIPCLRLFHFSGPGGPPSDVHMYRSPTRAGVVLSCVQHRDCKMFDDLVKYSAATGYHNEHFPTSSRLR